MRWTYLFFLLGDMELCGNFGMRGWYDYEGERNASDNGKAEGG